jgi:hypothetical protein
VFESSCDGDHLHPEFLEFDLSFFGKAGIGNKKLYTRFSKMYILSNKGL